ncbi:MAG: spheroidene monooxygenase [Pseudomonadota bacterium]
MAQAISLSFFRFDRPRTKHWALWQMPLAMPPLSRLPGIGFYKTLGSGVGESFRPWPNFGVYAVLATWPSLEQARAQVAEADVYCRYRERAVEDFTVYLAAVSVRGAWAGCAPFEAQDSLDLTPPIAVLTRASIRPHKVLAFWRGAPDIDTQTAREPALLFKRGLGELPWVRQVTFSIWRDLESMKTFAYRHPFHRKAAQRARQGGWFSEELFARFRVLGAEGRWEGRAPLAALEDSLAPVG